MTELELELVALGRELDFPATPALGPRVRARLETARRRPTARVWVGRRALVVAVAALAAALGAAFAVPPARTAVLEWLGLRGVTIERVPEGPRAPVGADLGLGTRVSLAEAVRRAVYEVAVPDLPSELGAPQEVYFTESLPGGQVALVFWRKDRRATILLTQFQAAAGFRFIEKSAGPGTTIEQVTVGGEPGYWLAGDPHSFVYEDARGRIREETLRLAGDTLLWQRGDVTFRLEGASSKEQALRIARSLRRV